MEKQQTRMIVETASSFAPCIPRNVTETGLKFTFLVELLAKMLFAAGQASMADLSKQMKLLVNVLEPVLAYMRRERLCEVNHQVERAVNLTYRLTDYGRLRAQDYLQKSQYMGAAPVPLEMYIQQIGRQSVLQQQVAKSQLSSAFTNIAISSLILEKLGAAINSTRAVYVYGPAGSGKTFIAENLIKVFTGAVFVPHAIVVEDEIIQVFDPLVHAEVKWDKQGVLELEQSQLYDERWLLCQRPVQIVGGELTLSMLDLEFDPLTRFYQAPPQVKANNGLLIIDDLGRQLASPRDIMNRWIVPLDRHVDFLTLHTGKRFSVPFDVKVIFSSNFAPNELADEAFLRRLGYKIYVGAMGEEHYRQIFKQSCQSLNLHFSEGCFNYLLETYQRQQKPLLASHPRDLLGQIRDMAHFEGAPLELSNELLDWAWSNYFETQSN